MNQTSDRRKVIIKLCRRDLKKDIIYACKQTHRASGSNSSRPGLFANESLTPLRNTILYSLRQMKRDPDCQGIIKGTSTYDGKVYVWIRPSTAPKDIRIPINSKGSLVKFVDEHIKKPLENFVQTWPQ